MTTNLTPPAPTLPENMKSSLPQRDSKLPLSGVKHALKLGLAAASLLLIPTAASADTPAQAWAKARVESGLIAKLKIKDSKRSKYSRSMPPPKERRARITSSSSMKDPHGRSFLVFEMDERYGSQWSTRTSGCVYKGTGNIYVKTGSSFRSADYLLGKSSEVVPDVCLAPSRDES